MEKKVEKQVFNYSFLAFIFFTVAISLCGCITSQVSRDVAANTDKGVENAKYLFYSAGQGNLADTYQNSSQAVKGAVMGGVAGAIIGTVYPGVGLFPATATGIILGASYGSYIDAQTTLRDQLENRGAIIITVGHDVTVIMPTARIFQPGTACIKSDAYTTLYLLADFINQHLTMLVKVTAYTNQMSDFKTSVWLSQLQADAITRFFTAAELNTRVISAKGRGAEAFIETPTLKSTESDNNRIEITFKNLHP